MLKLKILVNIFLIILNLYLLKIHYDLTRYNKLFTLMSDVFIAAKLANTIINIYSSLLYLLILLDFRKIIDFIKPIFANSIFRYQFLILLFDRKNIINELLELNIIVIIMNVLDFMVLYIDIHFIYIISFLSIQLNIRLMIYMLRLYCYYPDNLLSTSEKNINKFAC